MYRLEVGAIVMVVLEKSAKSYATESNEKQFLFSR